MVRWWWFLCVVGLTRASAPCHLSPGSEVAKAPGDNFYRLIINGDVERYAPNQRYVVTLVGSRTHSVVQQFTRFKLVLDPLDPGSERAPGRQGQFQLFADTLTKFDDNCTNSVLEADDLPKTEIQVMWMAPPPGSGCVLIKAMVVEGDGTWYAEDGQLSRRVCEDTTKPLRDCCACDHANYKMVFEGIWSLKTHPKDYPVKAQWLTHFSDVVGATHVSNFSFWGEGHIATDGFRSLAEWGSVDLLERELRERGGGVVRSVLRAPGLWYPRVNHNTSTTFTVDPDKHLLSFASMFGPSPDWVVGVSGLELCESDCTWVQSKVVDLLPYDAGTDNGVSYMSPNSETVPKERMYRITPSYPEDPRSPFYSPSAPSIPPLARVYITRDSLIHKGCDEHVLEMIVASTGDEDTDTPGCGVGAWSEWSPCSVSCGKGLRTRTRSYEAGTAPHCHRVLVQKEMCAATVPDCPPDAESPPESLSGVVGVGDVGGGVCDTSEWSTWSECSVTCGVGVRTRRRSFHDHMGYKKCPLTQIEENQKCMEPQCSAAETEVSDPGCPTTPWSGWSPCSSSCGRGTSLRTRLLLVAPEQQLHCSSRVELVQQRVCSDRDSCDIDMVQAKQICMLEAEMGPCRGVYSRWRFAALKGMCVPFSYGGCRGNRNNFLTREDCENTCLRIAGGGNPTQSNSPGLSVDSSQSQPTVDVGTVESAECEMSDWGEWSRCSVSCGLGFQERSRTIIREAGPGGVPCPTRLSRKRRCHRPC